MFKVDSTDYSLFENCQLFDQSFILVEELMVSLIVFPTIHGVKKGFGAVWVISVKSR